MAGQIVRTTSGMYVTAGQAALQARITNLKNAMSVNKAITAANFNELVAIYNRWVSHYHGMTDLYGIDTFGDSPIYGAGSSAWIYSSAVTGAIFNASSVTTINDIGITEVNSIIASINSIRSHHHTVTDTVWPDPADAIP